MRKTFVASLLLFASLSTGCAVRILHPVPHEETVYVPPPPQQILSRSEAIAQGEGYCFHQGLECRVRKAHLSKGGDVWKVHFDAWSRRAKGKVHMEIDSYSGRILKVDEKGQLKKRRHG